MPGLLKWPDFAPQSVTVQQRLTPLNEGNDYQAGGHLQDRDAITGAYVTDAAAGLVTNVFLLDVSASASEQSVRLLWF